MKTLSEAIQYYLNQAKVAEEGNTTISGVGVKQHYHRFAIDQNGDGVTVSTIPVKEDESVENHEHQIDKFSFEIVNDHSHSISNRDEE